MPTEEELFTIDYLRASIDDALVQQAPATD